MHGVKRSRLTAQAAEAKRQKEEAKIQTYVSLQQDVLARRKDKDYSEEALAKTTELLDLNPEFYTIWNYRRNILLHGLFPTFAKFASEVHLPNPQVLRGRPPEDIVKLLTTDLRLTTAYLQVHPKVYWIWNHRKWCLESVPRGPDDSEGWRNQFWKMELMLIEKMLDADARNFHAWDYRRYVLRSLPDSYAPPRTAQDELKYTQKKIEANFSNFSAWHCRTKILGGLWEGQSPEAIAREKDSEFELVRQALWTDPGDQSGWLYHRWLVGNEPEETVLRRELESTKELHETEPDSKWCMGALAHYTLLLARLSTTAPEESDKLRADAKQLLDRLAVIDPDRKERYRDFVKQI